MPKDNICKHCGAVNKHFSFQCYHKPAKPKTDKQKEKERRLQELNTFFHSQEKLITKDCENCGTRLNVSTPFFRRCVTAHILPKQSFKSVETCEDNIMYLGTFCGCHGKYDNGNAASRKKMKCYPLALERYDKFYHLLSDEEIVKAEKYLGL